MQPLRQWSPPPSIPTAPSHAPAANDRTDTAPIGVPAAIPDQDLTFCAEFAAIGGVAASEGGFKAGTDLLRMEASGLLDLIRSDEAPYGVIRVRLSVGARRLLGQPPVGPVDDGRLDPAHARTAAGDREAKRHGFEIARGMIGAAIKAELSSMNDGLPPALAARLMDRISRMPMPF
jgi:hypothetical protein